MSADCGREPRRRWIQLLALLPVAVFAFLGAGFYWALWNSDDRLPSTLIGKPVPEFALPPIEGRQDGLSSADLRGEVSIVNFWASWCAPCRIEMPLLVELAATGTVPIHGINYKDDPERALAFLEEVGDPYTRIGAEQSGRVAIDWGVYGAPETFLVDARGIVVHKHVGPLNMETWRRDFLPRIRKAQEPAS